MADDDDVTEVAQVADVLRSATMPPIHLPIATTQARAILASPWLAQRDARIRAEAWDEGYTRGFYDREVMPGEARDASEGPSENPYQEAPPVTVPDPTAPTATDVIAGALRPAIEHRRHYGLNSEDADYCTAAVITAIRGMDAETLADLIGGEVEASFACSVPSSRARVVGPWQETQP